MGEWGWIVAAYAVTYLVIVGYAWRLVTRARGLRGDAGEDGR